MFVCIYTLVICALEDDEVTPNDDMVPEQTKPAEQVVVAIPGGAGTILAGSSICLQCRCCSKSSPGTCQTTTCSSSFKCDPSGKCKLVQDKCGCGGAK